MSQREDVLRRVTRLLAKAERLTETGHDDYVTEALTLTAKAQELAQTYALTEAMIDAFRPESERVRPTRTAIRFSANRSFITQRSRLLAAISTANRCRVVLHGSGERDADLFGFADDVKFTETLYFSLLTQMSHEGERALVAHENRRGQPERNRYAWRRNFYIGFTDGAYRRLQEETQRVVAEVSRQHPGKAELVLVGRERQVDAMVETVYPDLKNVPGAKVTDGSSYSSGHAAGRQADVSGGRVPHGAGGYVGGDEQRAIRGER